MQASIVLNQGGNVAYTSLDEISGKVVVRVARSADVSNILVKLEGESRSRLLSSVGPEGQRPKPQIEYHKILYRVQLVFPPSDVLEGRSHMSSKAAYTLPQGQHEYPFRFKVPINNSCTINQNPMPTMIGLEVAKPAQRHVKKTLPPTLNGFPGEAEIRYFVKATINRHSIFKENPRAYAPFNFCPIEPPRAPSTGSEVYARQKHQFDSFTGDGSAKDKMKGILGKKSSTPSSPITSGAAPALSVDARLPEPAILTCNSDIPLRLIVKRLNDNSDPIYLQSLQVSLIGHTKVRAHDVFRTEMTSWIIMSKSNMGIVIGDSNDPIGTETVLDDRLWRGQALPNTVAPGFETCNIDRFYQLDVRIGLSYPGSSAKVRPGQLNIAQNIVLPLRLDTLVYSGIAPPPELLARMADARNGVPIKASDAVTEKLRTEGRLGSDFGAIQIPPTPIDTEGASGPALPARQGVASAEEIPYGDAPPSYEDAIASDLPPVMAPRPTYAPPPATDDPLFASDEKKGWH